MLLRSKLEAEGISGRQILPSHIAHACTLPWLHRDPFDRLLVAQAAVEGLTLFAADAALKH